MGQYDTVGQVLVVEDSPEDFEVLKRAFKKKGTGLSLQRFETAQEALDFLYQENSAEPPLILLDLNLPGMDGHALLESVKDDNSYKHIPIIVLSSSGNDDDIFRSYHNGANSYIQKPSVMEGYMDVVEDITEYWFSCASLPKQGCGA